VIGLKAVGIQAIVAKSFARIFYRAGLNQGLMLIESPESIMAYKKGDDITVDVKNGSIKINDQMFSFSALPARILAIRNAGGLLPYIREKLQENKD